MSNSDIRLQTSWYSNLKRKKLQELLGGDGIAAFIDLLIYCGTNKPIGNLKGMSNSDIEKVAQWGGEAGKFIEILAQLRFLDGHVNKYRIHDWEENNPWAAGSKRRSQAARKAIKSRWDKIRPEYDPNTERKKEKIPLSVSDSLPSPSPKESANAGVPEPLREFVREILPDCKPEHVPKQAHALELLIGDMAFVDKSVSPPAREKVVMDCLRWMRSDRTERGNWKGWASVFHSIPRLREAGCEKFKNAYAQWRRTVALDPDDPQYKRPGQITMEEYERLAAPARAMGMKDV